jgi:hypothetical protein
MKRNKAKAKGMRSGVSPYKKHGKRPCQHCQDITVASRRRAHTGEAANAL